MGSEIGILAFTAASIGFVHTITGPDHYLPFIVMGRARHWSLNRTLSVTALCGLGHVLGSIILGAVGIGLGWAVGSLEVVEGMRGNLAAWLLISFGLVYAVWGWRRSARGQAHTHQHAHADGTVHDHHHDHHQEHLHPHAEASTAQKRSLTPWALFVIFALGPCEPLIPILMYPAANASIGGLVLVASIFAVVTIATMLVTVYLVSRGVRMLPLARLERHTHTMAGLAIMVSGLAIRFLGL